MARALQVWPARQAGMTSAGQPITAPVSLFPNYWTSANSRLSSFFSCYFEVFMCTLVARRHHSLPNPMKMEPTQ
jgi:hypothetical protein